MGDESEEESYKKIQDAFKLNQRVTIKIYYYNYFRICLKIFN